MDDQPRLIDLIPMRLSTFAIIFLAGASVVAGLETLYVWMPQLAAMTSDGRVAAFDLDGEGSLAVWFSSMTLALAGAAALVVYSIRRHRIDDYRGHYRIWLWAALCWTVLSVDETASLHEGFKELMSHATGTRVLGDGSIWWVAVYFFVLAAVGTRLFVDMRECWLSCAALLATAACYVLAVATQLGLLLPELGARGVMVEEGAEMIGNLMLLLAMSLHARHVILDAEGLLSQRKPKPAKPDAKRTPSGTVVVHPPHGGLKRPSAWSRPARSPADVDEDEEEEVEDEDGQQEKKASTIERLAAPGNRKLTKAERKALRRKLAKMKAEREGRA